MGSLVKEKLKSMIQSSQLQWTLKVFMVSAVQVQAEKEELRDMIMQMT